MTLVLDLTQFEQHVRLRSVGFESCVVTPPEVVAQVRLARHYRHPWRTRASAFVDELLTLTVHPALSPAQARALPAHDRARLRLAVAAAYGCEQDWRALYGSHLSADERLLAVMYWQWRGRQVSVKRIHDAHQAHVASRDQGLAPSAALPADLASRMGATASATAAAAAAAEIASRSIAAGFRLPEFSSPAALSAVKALEVQTSVAADISKRFELPSLKAFEHINMLSKTCKALDNLQALTKPFGIGDPGTFAHAGLNTSVTDAMTGKWGANLLKVTGAHSPLAWHAPAGLAGMAGRWETNFGAAQALASVRISSPFMPGVWTGQLAAASTALQSLQHLTEPFRELSEAMEVVDRFERRWQNEALYFIISGFLAVCSLWEVHELAALDRDEVEMAVLLALEVVVGDGVFIAALRERVERAPYLNEYQRVNVDHALEHAAESEYMKACAGLYVGLEGAFWEAGYARAVVTLERKDARNTNKEVGFESMVKLLSLEPEFKTFVVRGLYSTVGNPYRHGGAAADARRQVLLGVAALAGWFEEFAGVQALTELVTRTGRALPEAIEQVLAGPVLLNP